MQEKLNVKTNKAFRLVVLVVFVSSFFGFAAGLFAGFLFHPDQKTPGQQIEFSVMSQEELVIDAVGKISPAVVSIVVAKDLPVDYGAWIIGSRGEPAVYPGSSAEEAGFQEDDIILEFNNGKITTENSLADIILKYEPEDEVILRVLRDKEEKNIKVVLGEYQE